MLRWTTNWQRPRRPYHVLVATLLLGLLWAAQPLAPVRAANTPFTVTKTADTNDGSCSPDDCSLREAIVQANSDAGPDSIVLSAATYTLSLAGNGDAASGDLNITGDLTITGALSSTTIIDANKIDRMFAINEGVHVRLANLGLRNGAGGPGGAINSQGNLYLDSLIVENNTATGPGGGMYIGAGQLNATNLIVRNNSASESGGGMLGTELTSLRVANSEIANNQAGDRGGGVFISDGGLSLSDVFIHDNSAVATGGGVYSKYSGTAIINSHIHANHATGDGGGIYSHDSGLSLADVQLSNNTSKLDGGGLVGTSWTQTTLRNVLVEGNQAVYSGGGIVNRDHSWLTAQSTTVRANQASLGGGILNVIALSELAETTLVDSVVEANIAVGGNGEDGGGIHSNGTLIISDSQVLANKARSGYGGGIYNVGALSMSGATVRDNEARLGGGMFAERRAHATIDTSLIASNSAIASGGGIFATGAFTLTNSSVVNNSSGSEGGGIIFTGLGESLLRNSTISTNESGATGGGLYNSSTGSLDLNNLTIANNVADGTNAGNGGGGGVGNPFGTLTFANTIIASNSNRASGSQEEDCAGTITSTGYNLVQRMAGCTVDGDLTGLITGQDAKLGPLANNGGPTPTHTLLSGSPAINTGNPAAPGSVPTACLLHDQRGVMRPEGPRCDIGAVERRIALAVDIHFVGDTGLVGVPQQLVFTLSNPTDQEATGVGFTSTLSDGLQLAADSALANGCGGAFLAESGGMSVALSGATLAANQSCTITLYVVAQVGGVYGVSSTPLSADGITTGVGAAATTLINNPQPLLSDARLVESASDGSLVLNGSGFVPTSAVMFSVDEAGLTTQVALPTSYVSSGELHATLSAVQRASLRSMRVFVVTPGPGGGTSNQLAISDLPLQRAYTLFLPIVIN